MRGGTSAVFLQARLDSSRLPGKALYELAGKPLAVHCMENLRRLPADRYCLLTDEASAPILAPFARGCGYELFAGPKDDVLARFALAAERYGVDHVWRGTADNPLVSLELCSLIRDAYLAGAADYCNLHSVPHGSCVEAVSAAALARVAAGGPDAFEREHVCPGVYRHPERFSLLRLDPPPALARPDINVSIDTIEDYCRLRSLFDRHYAGEPLPLQTAIAYLERQESD